MPESERGLNYIVVMVDAFSGWVEITPVFDVEAATVAKVLVENWFLRYGIPDRLITDMGVNMSGALIPKVCNFFKVQKIKQHDTIPVQWQG